MDRHAAGPTAFDQFEAAGWEQRATGYAQTFVELTGQAVGPLLDAAEIGPGTRVLDVGSGPGHVAAECAQRGATVTGLDVAGEMVALARRRYPGVRFEQGDAQRLPVADAELDAVVGNFAILHVGQPERVVAEAARVLVPGGRLALSTWDLPVQCRIVGVLVDAVGEAGAAPLPDIPDGPAFFRFADDAEFTALLAGGGFTGVRVHTLAFDHRFASAAALWDGLMDGTVRSRALVFGQPADVQARIRAAFDRNCVRHVAPDGLSIPVSVKIASGVRP